MHRSAALGSALLCACGSAPPTLLPPPFGPDPANPEAARFFFPTGVAIDPTSTWVVVTNANADRQYDGGAMYSFRAADFLTYFPPNAAKGTLPLPFPGPHGETDSLVGKVIVGNFSGPMVLGGAPTGSGPPLTAYTASRDTNRLNAVALDTVTGALNCRKGASFDASTVDCRAGSLDLSRKFNVEGPYGIVAARVQPPGLTPLSPVDVVLVSSLVPRIDETQSGVVLTSAHLAAVRQDDPSVVLYSTTVTDRQFGNGVGSGSMVFDDRNREVILAGCYTRFGSFSAGGDPSTLKCGTLFPANTSELRFLSVDAGGSTDASATRFYSLASQLHAPDITGLAMGDVDATTGLRSLYVSMRVPDAIARIGLSSDLAFLPIVQSVVTTSSQPAQLLRLLRPAGSPGTDLVVATALSTFQTSTTAGKLLVLDVAREQIVGQVEGLGDSPFAIAQFPPQAGDAGAHLVVTMFGSCRISLIDVPYADPASASLRATVGSCPK